ncbi:MAG: ATP-binding protein [Streptomycetaceae bacterium]|nr:ATP-binding protein [Streptomycetaceae bacterium]
MKPPSAFAAATRANTDAAPAPREPARVPAPSAPIGHLVAELRVPATARMAGDIRDFTGQQLRRVGATRRTVDDAVLLANELYANAVRHTSGRGIALRVLHDARRRTFAVLVDDTSDVPPAFHARRLVGPQAAGRGLALVAELAHTWGWHPTATGKSVWFSMSTTGTARAAHDLEEPPHA